MKHIQRQCFRIWLLLDFALSRDANRRLICANKGLQTMVLCLTNKKALKQSVLEHRCMPFTNGVNREKKHLWFTHQTHLQNL